MQIFRLTNQLLEQALEIYQNCLNQTNFSKNTLKLTNSYPYNHIYLAKIDFAICGLIDYSVISNQAFLNNIATKRLYRNCGVASNLMKSMITKCVDLRADSISLEVRASNQSAISLYTKFGFSKISKRRQLYSSPTEDGWVMTLEMK